MRKKTNNLIFPLLAMGVFLFFASNCKKDDDDNGNGNNTGIPVLSTTVVTDITQTTAISGGNITSDGGATIIAHGVCWSTSQTPTISDNKTENVNGTGSFTSNITGLEPNTTYYVRAYATNSAGTAYGEQRNFTTLVGIDYGSFTDLRDDKVYKTIVIGNQEWMAENLAYNPPSGNYWAYDNDDANVETYGYLYNWQTAMEVCPTGWHLPNDAEWTELRDYLGGIGAAGGKLKATGTIEAGTGLWKDPNFGATNETGFTALPGGQFNTGGTFTFIGSHGSWWSAKEDNANTAWYWNMLSSSSGLISYNHDKRIGFSVRCLKD